MKQNPIRRGISLILSMISAVFASSTPGRLPPAVTPAVCRREEAAPKSTASSSPAAAPASVQESVSARDLESLDVMTRGDVALRERLIDGASRRNPSGGRGWAVSKAEYDLWRDLR